MSLKIVSLAQFTKDVKKLHKKYRRIAEDLKALEQELLSNPKSGIELGHHCYKIRLKNSSIPTGKSGGFRVVYYYVDDNNNVYLMTMYAKSDLESVSNERLIEILNAHGL